MPCTWYGTTEEFQNIEPLELLTLFTKHIYEQSLEEAKLNPETRPQLKAWWNCIRDLKAQLFLTPTLKGYLLFEYEFPRSGGRRPDVLLLLPGELIVLEFKGYDAIKAPELNQISLYVRDFEEYHSTIQDHQLNVRGTLVCFAIKKCRELQRKIQNVATRYFPYFLDNAFVKRKLWPVYEIIWAW